MSDMDFAALRERLEAGVRPPAFAEIRARRRRRTRWVVAASGMVVLLVLGVTAAATAALAPHAPVVPAGPTPSASPSAVSPSASPAATGSPAPSASGMVAAAGPPEVLGLAGTSSGALYAMLKRCPTGCSRYQYTLLRSKDLGGSWSTVGPLPQLSNPSRLLIAGDSWLWIIDGQALWGSRNSGRDWARLPDLPAGATQRLSSSVAGGTLWIGAGNQVLTATKGLAATPTAAQPTGVAEIWSVRAVDDARAILAGADASLRVVWYSTANGGGSWTQLAEPCGGTPAAGSPWSTVAVGPDGTWWADCAGEPGAGQQPKWLAVSTDSGKTWSYRGKLEFSGYATDVYPVGHNVAWRTGGRADVYRTTNGTQWTDVAPSSEEDGPFAFVALDQNTVAYIGSNTRNLGTVHVTRDGGRNWTTHQLPTSA